ncbi:MAG: universal stress protein [Acidobacteriales bacterium]|nr:universal stress protein [Terriglobales bacterium]
MATLALAPEIKIKNILVAVDFSECSRAAFNQALNLATQFGSTLHLAHVLESEGRSGPDRKSVELLAETDQKLRAWGETARFRKVPYKINAVAGDLPKELESLTREFDIDLVVLGTRGHTGLDKLMLGSTAEAVFRGLDRPVLTVGPFAPRQCLECREFRKVLFPTDLSPQAARATIYVDALARKHHGHVTMVHVLPKALENNPDAPMLCQIYLNQMRHILPPDPGHAYTVDYVLRFGESTEEVVNLASGWEADLIVLGVRKARAMAAHLPGHTAYGVMTQAACPVLTVRS